MRYIMTIAIILAFFGPGHAWANPCYGRAVSFMSIPHQRPSTITLEAGRVKSINGNLLTYDLGKETITIQANSFAAERFFKDVENGRCSARETVTLEPARKSPLNTRFNAIDPRSRPH